MRGKFAPRRLPGCPYLGFNEARANCAGNFRTSFGSLCSCSCFNEARANCAGNSSGTRSTIRVGHDASMRPAQIAREIANAYDDFGAIGVASMRPAQIAREIPVSLKSNRRRPCASMRPAQIAREINCTRKTTWNSGLASMRPAQIAREIPGDPMTGTCPECGFNEARANCAGNSGSPPPRRRRRRSFNEARANCAGNCGCRLRTVRRHSASMRPAQIAREITHRHWLGDREK